MSYVLAIADLLGPARPEPDFLKAFSIENFGLGLKARQPETIFLSPARPEPDFFQPDPSLVTLLCGLRQKEGLRRQRIDYRGRQRSNSCFHQKVNSRRKKKKKQNLAAKKHFKELNLPREVIKVKARGDQKACNFYLLDQENRKKAEVYSPPTAIRPAAIRPPNGAVRKSIIFKMWAKIFICGRIFINFTVLESPR